MKIGVPRETRSDENRVAVTPDMAKKLCGRGAEVVVETGAGTAAGLTDEAYEAAGATIGSMAEAWSAPIVLKVQAPDTAEAGRLSEGTVLVSLVSDEDPEVVRSLVDRRATAIAMASVPRIARAQKMDALSSMANIAGYKAVLEAANAFGRYFPLLMTAAGTIPPAHVLVIGAGVAGLSAIVTARRLGAVVRAFDPRPATREQIESLGARFIDLDLSSEETEGGYATMQSEAFLEMEQKLLAEHTTEVDIVICAALVAGAAAPVLVTSEMVAGMKTGSVIVDMAVEQGGNCEASVAGEVVDVDGVTVIGYTNLAARVANHASQLYARNVFNLVDHLLAEEGLVIDLDDEITGAVVRIHEGVDRSLPVAAALEA